MESTFAAHVVSALPANTGGVVYFDGAGHWTSDLHSAQIARSAAGRNAMLRVASALAKDKAARTPALMEIDVRQATPFATA